MYGHATIRTYEELYKLAYDILAKRHGLKVN
jgi:hypothetical protein